MEKSKRSGCRVTAVVVTYNRKELLAECIQALLAQTVSQVVGGIAAESANTEKTEGGAVGCELEILVVDNASTDGTASFLAPLLEREPRVHYMFLEKNMGGAGGFCAGMKRAVEEGCDYVWIMDDDTIPKPQALEKLLGAADVLEESRKENRSAGFGFLSSEVLWTDGTPCRMNRQHFLDAGDRKQEELRARYGLRPVDQATFVSLLFSAEVIAEMGLPVREYFIWGDDKEYTLRLAAAYPCYYVPESVVVHKMGQNTGSNITLDSAERISRYFYAYRNDLATAKRRGIKDILIYFAAFGLNMARILTRSPDHKRDRLAVMWRGMLAGVQFAPKVEFAERKQRYGKGDII